MALERREHRAPGVGAQREGMEKKERLTGPAAVSDGCADLHVWAFRAMNMDSQR